MSKITNPVRDILPPQPALVRETLVSDGGKKRHIGDACVKCKSRPAEPREIHGASIHELMVRDYPRRTRWMMSGRRCAFCKAFRGIVGRAPRWS